MTINCIWSKKSDISKYKKGLTEKQKEKWIEVANSVLKQCLNNGGKQKDCEGKAIRVANSKVGDSNQSEGGQSMSKTKMKIPKKGIRLSEDDQFIELTSDDDGNSYFTMLAYSGGVMKHSLFGNMAIDVSGVKFKQRRIPILEEHDRSKKIGVASGKPSVDNNQINFGKVTVLENDAAREFKSNLDLGFPYQSSVSIRPLTTEELAEGQKAEVNGTTVKGPGVVIRAAEFKEASVCVFGVDEKTSVASFSEDELEEVEVDCVNNEEESHIDFANNPDYEGIETKNWDSVSKDLDSVVDSYYKFHPDAEKDEDDPVTRVDEMPAAMKSWIADLTLNGKTNTNEWKVLFSYPVVNHRTKKLNKNGVESAMSYAKQHGSSSVYNKARNLWDKHWGDKNNKQNDGGNKSMTFEELKENYPDLYAEIQNQFAEKDKQIQDLTTEKSKLEQSVQQSEDRIAKLEKAEQLRKEQDVKNSADNIVSDHLQASEIPERLHDKVRKQINFNDFVEQNDDGPALQVENFTEQVKAEIKDWTDTLGEFAQNNSVLGFSNTDDSEYEDEDKKHEDLSDHLVKLAVGEEKTQ